MSLLRHAEGQWYLEDVLAAIGGAHFAWTGIEASIRAAGWPSHTPTGLPAHARRLAVFAAGLHHSLAARVQLHLAGGVVDVAVGGAYRPVLRRTMTVDRTRFPDGTGVTAGSHVSHLDRGNPNTASLDAQHTSKAYLQEGKAHILSDAN